MPDEEFLREWERGITFAPTSRWDLGPVRDPAFLPREPNPVVGIRTEDGQVIWP